VNFPASRAVTVADIGNLVIDRVANFSTQASAFDHVAPPDFDLMQEKPIAPDWNGILPSRLFKYT
jgi:hypothetical protein